MARQREAVLSDAIREALALEAGLVLYRNSVGLFRANGGVRVWAGLPRGSADLVGLLMVHATISIERVRNAWQREDVEIGRFVALEVKAPGEIPTPEQIARVEQKLPVMRAAWERAVRLLPEAERHIAEQEAWLAEVRRFGGFAAYVDSVTAAREAIAAARRGESTWAPAAGALVARRKLFADGGRDAYVAAVLRADPAWRPRRHVTRALRGEELAAAREADTRTAARVRRLRGGA